MHFIRGDDMTAYNELLTEVRKPENAYSTKIEIAFDKAKKYDDLMSTLIGLKLTSDIAGRELARTKDFNGLLQVHTVHYIAIALLENDIDLMGISHAGALDSIRNECNELVP